ncbi:uncharacterized protein LOC134820578 isoform X1 [Bolinopsis microptera]|uniref:uncharacterized protein LOC134820578 isoform X1 n=1 Tax=Bolinopsis microptera TaxID=2820187 RepID=UPI003079BCF4
MDQWIEGVGNEVTVCFLVLSGLLAFSVYKFISSWQPGATFNDVAQQQSAQESENSTPSNSQPGTSQPGNSQPGSLFDMGRRGSYDEPHHGAMEITVRYRESSRTVFIPENKSLLDLKKYCFQKVLEEGKRVHMVYQGHLLRPDSAPLSEFTLDNPSTFICQISHSANSSSSNLNNSAAGSANVEDLDISGLLLPVLGLILFCSWMVAMSLTASVSANVYVGLLFLSVLYVIALVSSIT